MDSPHGSTFILMCWRVEAKSKLKKSYFTGGRWRHVLVESLGDGAKMFIDVLSEMEVFHGFPWFSMVFRPVFHLADSAFRGIPILQQRNGYVSRCSVDPSPGGGPEAADAT